MAKTLFQNTELTLGARVEFYFQWSKWITSFNQTSSTEKENESNKSNESIGLTSHFNRSTVPVCSSNQMINLSTILNSNAYGQSLQESLKSNGTNQLNENLRKMLCESILQYCITNKHDLTTQDSATLAKQICTLFPKEEMVH